MTKPSVLVVTPTTGSIKSVDAIESVAAQTYPTEHLIVIDGPEHEAAFNFGAGSTLKTKRHTLGNGFCPVATMVLPFNTGKAAGQSYWGHRIFAGVANFVNHDIIMFLDDDNWYEPTHVETQVANFLEKKLHVSFSLRNIVDEDKTFVCKDDCESLGLWPVWTSKPGEEHYHVDTSAYAFTREFLIANGRLWHGGYGQDRNFLAAITVRGKIVNGIGCTGKYTLNYRLGSTGMSASKDFFLHGNKMTNTRYPDGIYPWAS